MLYFLFAHVPTTIFSFCFCAEPPLLEVKTVDKKCLSFRWNATAFRKALYTINTTLTYISSNQVKGSISSTLQPRLRSSSGFVTFEALKWFAMESLPGTRMVDFRVNVCARNGHVVKCGERREKFSNQPLLSQGKICCLWL